jgi:predicted  nucleic acid-binding Zn-ribbon protein
MIDDVRFSATLPAADVERALSRIVTRALEERGQEISLSLDDIRDKLRGREREVRQEVDSLYEKSLASKKEVEKSLEELKEKINRKANWYLVPVGAIILLTGIIALWALVGSVALKLRDDVAKTVNDVGDLQEQVTGKQATLKILGEDLVKLQAQLEEIRTGTALGQINGRLDKVDIELQRLSREFKELQASKARQQPAPSKPPNARRKP